MVLSKAVSGAVANHRHGAESSHECSGTMNAFIITAEKREHDFSSHFGSAFSQSAHPKVPTANSCSIKLIAAVTEAMESFMAWKQFSARERNTEIISSNEECD